MRSVHAFSRKEKDKELARVFGKLGADGGSVQQLEKFLQDPRAKFDDEKYYGEGKMHEDEQREKTELLKELPLLLSGLEEPDDPGFHPPVKPYHPPTGPKGLEPHFMVRGTPHKKYIPETGEWDEEHQKEYPIFPFQYSQVPLDATVLFVGKRRSGKTKAIISFMEYLRPYFPRVYVFTKTKCSAEYSKYLPEQYIIDGLDIKKLYALFELQKKWKKKKKEGKFEGNMRVLVIIDDCLSDGLKYEGIINAIFYEGRHLDMFLIISMQDTKGIHPGAKGNTDLAIFFRMAQERDKTSMKEC